MPSLLHLSPHNPMRALSLVQATYQLKACAPCAVRIQKTLSFAPHPLAGTSSDKYKVYMNQAMLHVAVADLDAYPDGKCPHFCEGF
jgi:hypothetical protein